MILTKEQFKWQWSLAIQVKNRKGDNIHSSRLRAGVWGQFGAGLKDFCSLKYFLSSVSFRIDIKCNVGNDVVKSLFISTVTLGSVLWCP